MKTKFSQLVITPNKENSERVQRLLFNYKIFWNYSRDTIQNNNSGYFIISKVRTEIFGPNLIYLLPKYETGEIYTCDTLRLTGDQLTEIIFWLESELEPAPKVEAGQLYKVEGIDTICKLVVDEGCGAYRLIWDLKIYNGDYCESYIQQEIKAGRWVLIT